MSDDDTVSTDNTQSTKDSISHLLAPTYAKGDSSSKAHTPAPSTPVRASADNVPPPSTTPVYGPLPSPHSPLMADAKKSGYNENCVQVDLHLSSMDKIFGIVAPSVVRYKNHRLVFFRLMMPTPYGPEHVKVQVEGKSHLHLKDFFNFFTYLSFRI